MNIKEIKSLAEILKNAGLTSIEVKEGETTIRLEKAAASASSIEPALQAPITIAPVPAAPPVPVPNAPAQVDFNNLKDIKSPMVGMFYDSPSPESDPYVKVGTHVKKGDVLCIIEAMKLLNEITADTDGEIVDICAKNGEIVEYGQTLFKIS